MDYTAFLTAAVAENAVEPVVLAVLVVLGLLGVILALLVSLALYVYFALALGKIAKKRGQKRHWLSWIPIANLFLFPMMTGRKWWWGFLFFVPVVSVILMAICLWDLLDKSDYDGRWALILIAGMIGGFGCPGVIFLAFLVMLGVLAWGKK
ncbi:MAG: hypothetical protein WC919_02950 [Candidatus Paceibacterota bacterium]|jgi:hypothetical protein